MALDKYDYKLVEKSILAFWKDKKVYEKLKKRNKNGEKFYFLDGPPYTSGRIHIGQAWNYSMKDMVLRYKRMLGYHVWDRAGYDMLGLPTEHKVQAKFDLKTKEDIERYGVELFVKECLTFSKESAELMTQDFIKLGCWMDFENAYMPITKTFMEGEWWLIKKAHENKRLYEDIKVMTWCPDCATAIAKHELEYKEVVDKSIFIKFKVKGKDNEYLIIWTTTPWTIPFNLAVMANPEIDYIKAKVENEVWILAKGLAGPVIRAVADKDYQFVEEFKGEKLKGLAYEHPFEDVLKHQYDKIREKSPNIHTVVLSTEYVDLSAGSGLVHMAPGCGPEDYEVGRREGISPFNNINEYGNFPEDMGEFSGLNALKDNKKFIDALQKRGSLIAVTDVPHDYAHCWRCHGPVVFKTTKQWFFKVEDLKEQMIEENKKVYWMPDWAGSRNFDSWLKNLRDNSITRQRVWGTPVPIWRCGQCKDYVVVGSVEELEELGAKNIPKDLHKPWIDEVTIKCNCGGTKRRIPDILDVWIDAGTNSWTCLDYPENQKLIKEWWPADFILEGSDQIRGWFNLLLVASMISFGKHPYKRVYMHGFINDIEGVKMSKSLGNVISPYEIIDKYGVDTLRFYLTGNSEAGVDMNFSWEECQLTYRNFFVLWNIHNFLLDLTKHNDLNPRKLGTLEEDTFGLEEKYIMSRTHSTLRKVTILMDAYAIHEVPKLLENLYLDISRTYIQLVRDKASTGDTEDKAVVAYCLYKCMMGFIKMASPVVPYLSEAIYQNLKEEFGLKEESVHLFEWPQVDKKYINEELEERMASAQQIIQTILSARDKVQIGRRWPLKEVIVVSKNQKIIDAAEELRDLIKQQTNIKSLDVSETFPKAQETVKPDYAKLAPEFKQLTPKIIAKLAVDSKETILSHINKKGSYDFEIEGQRISIKMEHLLVEKTVPYPYVEIPFGSDFIYVNEERTEELEAEGYAREIMRFVQSMRKTAGLEKSDRIVILIQVDSDLNEMLAEWKDAIKEKIGASLIAISEVGPAKVHKHCDKLKIKDKEVSVYFDKV